MRPTGIVRRVDDLGRIVIPKEIRKTMHIQEGTPMEYYVDTGGIYMKKYYPCNQFGAALIDITCDMREAMDDVFMLPETRATMQSALSLIDQAKSLLLDVERRDMK